MVRAGSARASPGAGDISYIPTDEGWLYLQSVLDLGSRRLLGWRMDDNMATPLVADALEMAVAQRGHVRGVIFHSDRGSQYLGGTYRDLCEHHGIRQSAGRVATCFDNAVAESFWASLKRELVHRYRFATRAPGEGRDHRLDPALQRDPTALLPRQRSADRVGAQLPSDRASPSRIATCPVSGGKPIPPRPDLPVVYLQRVSDRKTVKTRVHIDLYELDAPAKIASLLARGATLLGAPQTGSQGGWWQVLADPEGNEFCVCDARCSVLRPTPPCDMSCWSDARFRHVAAMVAVAQLVRAPGCGPWRLRVQVPSVTPIATSVAPIATSVTPIATSVTPM